MLGGIYALIALGLVLVYKATKVLNIAYGEIMMILAYILCTFFLSMGLNLGISLILVFVIGGLLGLLLERLFMRPLIGEGFLPMIMLTLFISILLKGIATIAWGDEDKVLSIMPEGELWIGQVFIPYERLFPFVIALLIFILMVILFRYTRVGLAMRAVAEDHQVSQAMGIGVKRIFALSWLFSCIVAAVSGLLLGGIEGVNSDLGHIAIAKGIPVLLLGGLESIPGALLGGLIIGIVELMGGAYIDPSYREIIPFVIMLIILIIRPHGLFGERTIERI